MAKKTILVAPLFWGLGHAARCIPIVKALQQQNYNVLLGSDGEALLFLRKEFPSLSYIQLPSYGITYPKNGNYFKWKMFWNLRHIQKAISSERKIIKELVSEDKIHGIISDNRLGVRNNQVPSVIITHQLNVLSGNTSSFSSKLHQIFIRKFDECWVPDVNGKENLSGRLGHLKNPAFSVKFIGPISRFQKKELPKKYDVLVLISGPEPQRTLFEAKIMEAFKSSEKSILVVQGIVEVKQKQFIRGKIIVINFMKSEALETAINESEVVVSRSGYTTILDLAALEKKAYFVPTPGQYEQIYLAKRLKILEIVPSCTQKVFTEDKLNEIHLYKGLKDLKITPDFRSLFRLFEGK